MIYDITIDGQNYRLDLARNVEGWTGSLDGRELEIDAVMVGGDVLSLRIGSHSYEVRREVTPGGLNLWVGGKCFAVEVRDPRSLRSRGHALDDHGPRKLLAPMSGKVVRIMVSEGEVVDQGSGVLVVEAMKMQNEIKSPKKGTIRKVMVREGEAVNAGDALLIVE